MNDIVKQDKCSGCTACMNSCPKKAITMKKNEEGFYYPIIDMNKCIDCGLCKKVCPALNNKEGKKEIDAYACYNKNEKIRLDSSSGGIFNVLAEYIIENKGIVYGAAFDEQYMVKHIAIKCKKEIKLLRNSKYLQSELNDIFVDVKNNLQQEKLVLFTGTPCQIEGLKLFLKKDYDNLYTQDIICHGVPSPLLWDKYLSCITNSEIKYANFRNKDNGWSNFGLYIKSDIEYNNSHKDDKYFNLFLSNIALRMSCYNCSSKKKYRNSDITLADFWGIDNILPEFNDNKGVSLVIVNSDKGKKLFNEINNEIIFKEVDFDLAIADNPSMIKSCDMPKGRLKFFDDLNRHDFKYVYDKYNSKKLTAKKIVSKLIPKKLKTYIKGKLK